MFVDLLLVIARILYFEYVLPKCCVACFLEFILFLKISLLCGYR